MDYISVCSGIEAATVAWEPLGFKPLAFSEIDAFPSSVLKHHYPDVPNAGDFTTIQGDEYGQPDILVGGTPCQAFSIAGKRGGLSDARGNLALEYIKLAYRSNPEFILWENVPGVLSSSKGRDFRSFLHGLTGVDVPVPKKGWKTAGLIVGLDGHYSIAWRVLDAQFAGVPQRRRRVFLVGHIGDWRRAVAVLLERESLLWNPPPSRKARKDSADALAQSAAMGGEEAVTPCWWDGGQTSQTLDAVLAKGQTMPEKNRFPAVLVPNSEVAFNNTGAGWWNEDEVAATVRKGDNQGGGGARESTIVFSCKDYGADAGDIAPTLRSMGHHTSHANAGGQLAVAISSPAESEDPVFLHCNKGRPDGRQSAHEEMVSLEPIVPTLTTDGHSQSAVAFVQNSRDEVRLFGGDGQTVGALAAEPGAKQQCYIAFQSSQSGMRLAPTHATLDANNGSRRHNGILAIGLDEEQNAVEEGFGCLKARREGGGFEGSVMTTSMVVRRLIPLECERLQGFPDHYTQVPHRGKAAADGPRYKAIGNSMAVPVMRWIGRRMETFRQPKIAV